MFSTLLYQVLDGMLTFQSIDQLINHGYIFFVQYTANINITTHISGPKKKHKSKTSVKFISSSVYINICWLKRLKDHLEGHRCHQHHKQSFTK